MIYNVRKAWPKTKLEGTKSHRSNCLPNFLRSPNCAACWAGGGLTTRVGENNNWPKEVEGPRHCSQKGRKKKSHDI